MPYPIKSLWQTIVNPGPAIIKNHKASLTRNSELFKLWSWISLIVCLSHYELLVLATATSDEVPRNPDTPRLLLSDGLPQRTEAGSDNRWEPLQRCRDQALIHGENWWNMMHIWCIMMPSSTSTNRWYGDRSLEYVRWLWSPWYILAVHIPEDSPQLNCWDGFTTIRGFCLVDIDP